ncbi:hypothetical protein FLK61_38270 [Paenalkalicoccus suaedae]|uniref:Uncharacterized protein n=1 Tax=Paenalkalicoccus suaedae TaxID=2592382 RepID=A0A859FID7_9BACI|nr:hypothetical protein [Paenalkalicoccus suaedae]QKS72474.1 hypothetical protein FLK61_38270 [Paenalkalicoccus suaedae]
MDKKIKRWNRIYLFLYIVLYGFAVPIGLLVFLFLEDESFPVVPVVVAFVLPILKRQHMERLRNEAP